VNKDVLFSIRENAWLRYVDDPLPGWGSKSFTIFDVPSVPLDTNIPRASCAIFSVPFDSTASTREGARYGPRAIREASLAYSSQLRSRGSVKLRNMRTGALVNVKERTLVDFGDLHVYPSNPEKQMQVTAEETFRVAIMADLLVMLGGEHSLSFASFCGVAAAAQSKGESVLGYVQIDHHFDFGNTSILHGPFYHGSNARRISEHPLVSPGVMGFVGVGDLTSATQYNDLVKSGTAVRSIADIRQRGFEVCLREALDQVASKAHYIYASLDIDVCDTSTASGTGHVTVGGINATELLSAASILQDYPIIALDVMEVSPYFDRSGATAHLAARFLFEWLFLERVLEC
jgi:agmatinase